MTTITNKISYFLWIDWQAVQIDLLCTALPFIQYSDRVLIPDMYCCGIWHTVYWWCTVDNEHV